MRRKYKLIPLLVLLYFFIHFITDYFYFLKPAPVLITFAKYFVVTLLLFLIGYRFIKKKEKSTLVFSTLLFLFLFFGSITDTLAKYNLFNPSSGASIKYLLLYFSAAVVVLLVTWRLNSVVINKLLKVWFLYSIVVIVYDVAVFFVKEKPEKKYLSTTNVPVLSPGASKPPVFFLLFDMYSSEAVYRKYFHFDNSAIHNFLEQKDFFVTRNSHSIYDATYYSLCSTLNLDTLAFMTDKAVSPYKVPLLGLRKTQNSSFLTAFRNAGYQINNYSFFNLLGQRSPLNFDLHEHADNVLTSTTLYNRLLIGLEVDIIRANKNLDLRFIKNSWSDDAKEDFEFLDNAFNKIVNNTSSSAHPSFSYFHFLIPHWPSIYDSTGKENPLGRMYQLKGMDDAIDRYNSYTIYGNRKIMHMVNLIFEKVGKNVIIIIQGDHGYREFENAYPPEVKYGIFNSVYLPGKNYDGFSDIMTPIQTFKTILKNQYHSVME